MKNFETPYYMVFFSIEMSDDLDNFEETYLKMDELVAQQEGYLGDDEIKDTDGKTISICYWKNLDAIKAWRGHLEHQIAIKLGKEKWFKSYQIRIAKVEYVLGF